MGFVVIPGFGWCGFSFQKRESISVVIIIGTEYDSSDSAEQLMTLLLCWRNDLK